MAEKQMDQSQARRRRRDGSSGAQQRLCTHCGRNFKRSEHLERHVRTRWLPQPQYSQNPNIPIREENEYWEFFFDLHNIWTIAPPTLHTFTIILHHIVSYRIANC